MRKLFATDIQRIKGIGAIGAVLEEVFFGFGELFTGLVLMESIAATGNASCLDGKDEVE